jgi:hypothetical protein
MGDERDLKFPRILHYFPPDLLALTILFGDAASLLESLLKSLAAVRSQFERSERQIMLAEVYLTILLRKRMTPVFLNGCASGRQIQFKYIKIYGLGRCQKMKILAATSS